MDFSKQLETKAFVNQDIFLQQQKEYAEKVGPLALLVAQKAQNLVNKAFEVLAFSPEIQMKLDIIGESNIKAQITMEISAINALLMGQMAEKKGWYLDKVQALEKNPAGIKRLVNDLMDHIHEKTGNNFRAELKFKEGTDEDAMFFLFWRYYLFFATIALKDLPEALDHPCFYEKTPAEEKKKEKTD